MEELVALDLFAGTGWGVACQRLGIEEFGVEIMPEAVATRTAARMTTVYHDVWDGLLGTYRASEYTLLIASPPCQTFSVAGKGAGRTALGQVLAAIEQGAFKDAERLHSLTKELDPRTALVLTPLAHIFRDMPTYVVLEQVPTVLPVWEAYAETMRALGYSVVTAVLNAEQYGVPQTRRRAILIGRLDGVKAKMPTPTHSRYYPRDWRRFDEGVLPWVSMYEALGRGLWDRPSPTITGGGTETGGAEPIAKFARYSTSPSWKWGDHPATTIAGDPRLPQRGHHERQMNGALRLSQEEAAALQTFPADFPFQGTKGKRFLQIGNAVPPLLAEAILSTIVPAGVTRARSEELELAA